MIGSTGSGYIQRMGSPRLRQSVFLSLCLVVVASWGAAGCSDDAVTNACDDGYLGGDEGAGSGGGGVSDDDGADAGDPEPGQLSAGEWRDLDDWDFWLDLADPMGEWGTEFHHWGFDTRARVPVLALADGEPVVDVAVVIRDSEEQILWHARTDNEGHAELWPELLGPSANWPLTISSGDASVELGHAEDGRYEQVVLELPAPDNAAEDLDLMFVVDTTGSMTDELSYLQAELGDVISRLEDEVVGNAELRLSVNFYRDHGDEFVVRSFPFTTDVSLALSQLEEQGLGDGGDFPEAVEEALADAIFEHEWSADARARLLFLILDAPPHDTAAVRASLDESIRAAAERGIRVIPVAASGIDKDTEFLLRHIDIATGSTYVFLTDHSGIGNEHLEPTVGEYTVEYFNDLLVRLIAEAMA